MKIQLKFYNCVINTCCINTKIISHLAICYKNHLRFATFVLDLLACEKFTCERSDMVIL